MTFNAWQNPGINSLFLYEGKAKKVFTTASRLSTPKRFKQEKIENQISPRRVIPKTQKTTKK